MKLSEEFHDVSEVKDKAANILHFFQELEELIYEYEKSGNFLVKEIADDLNKLCRRYLK